MKYVIYARKSTEDEDRQVLSIEAQLFELKKFAAQPSLKATIGKQSTKFFKTKFFEKLGESSYD